MRKFYSILNMLIFCFVLYYITCNPSNENLKHATIMMGGIAILAAVYMGYLEYTDNSEEVVQTRFAKMKENFSNKLSELSSLAEDVNEKERHILGLSEENRELVEENIFTKNLVIKLNDQLKNKKNEGSSDLNNQFQTPSSRFNIDHKQLKPSVPNTDTNNNQFSDENYHFTQFTPQQAISQSSGGPPPAINTMDDNEPVSLEDRMREYTNFTPVAPQQAPPMPDALKPIETNPKKGGGMGGW